jgi:hypothetical protein
MAFDFNDILRMIQGGGPSSTVMDAQASAPPQQPPPPQQASAPEGVPTPVTNPKPVAQAPQAYQSPSDLANMYVQLMKDNRNAQQLDSGLNLIAAGLSNSPTNRAALIAGASGGHGAGGMSLSANDLINFQKQAEAQKQQLIMQQALPALMKQYKMTPAQIQALQASGQLGDVLKHFTTENLAQVKDANGQTHMVAPRTGKIVATLGSETEDPTQFVAGPKGQELRNLRTGEAVGAPVGLPPDNQFVTGPTGQELRSKISGEAVGTGVGLPPTNNKQQFDEFNAELVKAGKDPITPEAFLKMLHPGTNVTTNVGKENFPHVKPETGQDYVRNPDGTIKYDAEGKPTLYDIKGGDPAKQAEVKAQEKIDKEKKERIAKAQTAFAAGNVGQAVRNAFEVVDKPGATGFLSRIARQLDPGGTPAADMDAALSTINANTAFTQLKAMRESSASGASGLGQLTEKEGQMLSSVISDLRAYQSTGKVKEGLARVEAAMTLLASDSFEKGTDIEGFNKALSEQTQQILAREHNRASGAGGSKVRVVPR